MVFTRPSSLPYPTTYHRFTVNRNGVTTRLRIQDLTDDMTETAMEMLTTFFPRDEPPCKYIGVTNHPTALAELKKLWRDSINEKISLVCVLDEDGPIVMVGVNVLTVVCKDDKDEPFKSQDKVWSQLFGAVDTVARSVDVFKHYGVDKYLNAYGLVVASEWRGMNIGKEILRARIPLCKALGVKATATVFTAAASQTVAKKAGFEELSSFTYEDLAKKGFVFPGIEKDTKSSKLMGMLIE